MSEVHTVTLHLSRDRVALGYYTIDDNLLTMTWDDGTPVILDDGQRLTHELRPDDSPRAIAAVLAGQIRRSLLNETVPGFSRDIDYPEIGIA